MSILLPPGRLAGGPVPGVPVPGRTPGVGRGPGALGRGGPPADALKAAAGRLGVPEVRRARSEPRERLLDGVIDAAVDGRLEQVSVAELCHAAGVRERRSFYRWFASKQDAFLQACLETDAAFRVRIERTFTATSTLPAPGRVRGCVRALVGFVEEDDRRAEAWIVHGHEAGSDFAIAREQTIRWLVGLGMLAGPGAAGAPSSRAVAIEMALGGVHEIVLSRLAAGRASALVHETDLMVDLLLQPFGVTGGDQEWPAADPRDPRAAVALD